MAAYLTEITTSKTLIASSPPVPRCRELCGAEPIGRTRHSQSIPLREPCDHGQAAVSESRSSAMSAQLGFVTPVQPRARIARSPGACVGVGVDDARTACWTSARRDPSVRPSRSATADASPDAELTTSTRSSGPTRNSPTTGNQASGVRPVKPNRTPAVPRFHAGTPVPGSVLRRSVLIRAPG